MFQKNFRFFLLASVLLLTMAGCAGVGTLTDSRPVEAVVHAAEEAVKAGDYAGAARLYAVVINKEPGVGRHYLRQAELLERLGKESDARHSYRQGLAVVVRTDPDRGQLVHRAALLEAKNRAHLDIAEHLVARMPARSVELFDTTAFLYYQSGQYDRALELLRKALGKAYHADQKGLLLYHMALVYAGLKDRDNTFGALYYALNHVEHLGVVRDIETFWRTLNDPALADLDRWPPGGEQCVEAEQAVVGRARMITIDY
jgi:tetratricopeptide (TPR) repeat protein